MCKKIYYCLQFVGINVNNVTLAHNCGVNSTAINIALVVVSY